MEGEDITEVSLVIRLGGCRMMDKSKVERSKSSIVNLTMKKEEALFVLIKNWIILFLLLMIFVVEPQTSLY